MDILNRKLLKVNDDIWFYVCSRDEPYVYLRMKGKVKQIKRVFDEQIIYLVELEAILENDQTIHAYVNGHKYKVYDVKNSLSRTKPFYTFDIESNKSEVLSKDIRGKYYIEVSSAVAFHTKEIMQSNFRKSMNTLKEMLVKQLSAVNSRLLS